MANDRTLQAQPTIQDRVNEIMRNATQANPARFAFTDDNDVNRKMASRVFAQMLKAYDKSLYQLDIMPDGKDAIEAATRNPYDLMVFDVEMPTTGPQAVKGIREHEAKQDANFKRAAIYFCSAASPEIINQKMQDVGLNEDHYQGLLDKVFKGSATIVKIERSLSLDSAQLSALRKEKEEGEDLTGDDNSQLAAPRTDKSKEVKKAHSMDELPILRRTAKPKVMNIGEISNEAGDADADEITGEVEEAPEQQKDKKFSQDPQGTSMIGMFGTKLSQGDTENSKSPSQQDGNDDVETSIHRVSGMKISNE